MFKKKKFNHYWTFSKQSPSFTLEDFLKGCNKTEVVLPHDYLITQSNDLYESSSGWYEKTFEVTLEDDKLYYLRFEGVYMDSKVYINNQLAKEWKYGYSTFEVNMTKYLKNSKNTIIVKTLHEAPNSRWYSGAGIFRDVYYIKRQINHIVPDGIYVHLSKNERWRVDIETELRLEEEFVLTHELMGLKKVINQVKRKKDKQVLFVQDPKLWSIDEPNLYELKTTLSKGDVIYDEVTQNIGFKEVILSPDKGLILNGKKIKLNGVCEHHDLGSLGAAFNKEMMRIRLLKLKEMGVNAIRTGHSIPAKGLMELADELGFFIASDAFDMWERHKTQYDYARFFDEWIAKDVKSWVKRDRNHVSLLMWSIGNEIYDTHVSERGQAITKRLLSLVLKYDPKRNAVATIGSNFMPWENAQKCADIVKCAGYNYAEKLYEDHHLKHPDWIIYGSETGSIVQSRGIYHFPLSASILNDDDKQCSSLGNSVTSWGAKSLEDNITIDRDIPYSLGQFIWTGFDYIGEPTPYDTKNAYFGQIDTAGFEKDSFYVYQAAWRDKEEHPMIHIFPYWQFNEGQVIDVRVVTNACRFELYLNDKLIDNRSVNIKTDKEIIQNYAIPFEKGELKAFAYNEENELIATCIRHSFGSPDQLVVDVSRAELKANGVDIAEVSLSVIDKNGYPVEDCKLPLTVKVTGSGYLAGLDNGDSTDYTSYQATTKRMFQGKLKALIRSTYQAGEIKIEVSGKGLKPVTVNLNVKEVPLLEEEVSNIVPQVVDNEMDFIPINRIDLSSDEVKLDKNHQEVSVQAYIYPKNATEQELSYRVTTDKGVSTNLAQVKATEYGCVVKALGDGEFTLRCMANNGKDHPDVISTLTFEANDLGIAYKNPYEFVSAGLYDQAVGEIGAGNERGISTDQIEKSAVVFHDIDFGDFGSNTISLPIFAFEGRPFDITVYDGHPNDANTNQIGLFHYDLPTIWDVYQSKTYVFDKRLNGIKSLAFEVDTRIHLKGFQFERQEKAYQKLSILECDVFYGDSYEVTDWGMKDIGNNVSFTFSDMNYEKEVTSITICGRSVTDKNTIRLTSNLNGYELNQVLEFEQTNDFKEETFEIKPLKGTGDITFIFLPGSQFDFKWFKFQ